MGNLISRRSSSHHSSSDSLLYRGRSIPIDILGEILSRIPASSLKKLKLVCKQWYALIHDPNFIYLHLEHACRAGHKRIITLSQCFEADAHLTILDESYACKDSFTLPSGRSYILTASCNGLLCISDDQGDVHLLNPATWKHRCLPEPTRPRRARFLPRCYFGYHPPSKTYKVLRIYSREINKCRALDGSWRLQLEVFTLGTNYWKHIGGINYLPHYDGVTINGVMYWLTLKSSYPEQTIESFDLEEEKFESMLFPIHRPVCHGPNYLADFYGSNYIAELDGSLCFVASPYGSSGAMDIWVMDDVANHVWVHRYRILVHVHTSWRTGGEFWCSTPVVIHKGKVLVVAGGKLCSHDLESMSESSQEILQDRYLHKACVHVESLVSLGSRQVL